MRKGSKPSAYRRQTKIKEGSVSAWPRGLEWLFLRLNKMRKLD